MRKTLASAFILFMFVLSGTVVFAQGRGPSHVPAGPVGGGPRTSTGSTGTNDHTEHGKSADHQGADNKGTTNFESRIENNPQLMSRLQSLLPMGTDLKTAAMGFRNQGQFIAALHVSKNLNIPFDQLKAKMTGDHPESLGKAIQELRPTMSEKDAKAAEDTAEKQTKETLNTKVKPTT